MNVQYAIRGGELFVLEVNPRASRTGPVRREVDGRAPRAPRRAALPRRDAAGHRSHRGAARLRLLDQGARVSVPALRRRRHDPRPRDALDGRGHGARPELRPRVPEGRARRRHPPARKGQRLSLRARRRQGRPASARARARLPGIPPPRDGRHGEGAREGRPHGEDGAQGERGPPEHRGPHDQRPRRPHREHALSAGSRSTTRSRSAARRSTATSRASRRSRRPRPRSRRSARAPRARSRTPRSRKRYASDSGAPRGPRLRRDDRPFGPRLRDVSGLDGPRHARGHARPLGRRLAVGFLRPARDLRARIPRAARAGPRAPFSATAPGRPPSPRSRSPCSEARSRVPSRRASARPSRRPPAGSPPRSSSSPRSPRPPPSRAARRSTSSSAGASTRFP